MEHLALGPLDGRYSEIRDKLSPYFSEYALTKNRVWVEINWLISLIDTLEELKNFDKEIIKNIYNNFNEEDYFKVKEIEKITKHDVKAVELFVGEKLKEVNLNDLISFVHIGCTSEDINNTAYANMIKSALNEVWKTEANKLIDKISEMAEKNKNIPMLAHTHGQPATPTTVGKEFAVFLHRFKRVLNQIDSIKICSKFNGATGNYSAISVAYPEYNWQELSKTFVEKYLGLEFNPVTTQIESHDYIVEVADSIRHFNNILLDLDVDMWIYISKEYFKQVAIKGEVGSSTMPHKVNPIKFENSEANVDMSNAILVALSNKLPRSRMQRDLSDSSTQRNIGLGFGYSLQAIKQTTDALNRVSVNEEKLANELNNRWELLAEPIQTILRKYKIPDAYNTLKELTRGKSISKEDIQEFILSLDILSQEDKDTLLNLTPEKYIGKAEYIVENELKS